MFTVNFYSTFGHSHSQVFSSLAAARAAAASWSGRCTIWGGA